MSLALDRFTDELDQAYRKLLRNLTCCDRVLVVQCNSDLTPSQAYTLLTLKEMGEVSMNELAEEMRLHGTTMTRMVDALVEKGLVERQADPNDRRVVLVRLKQGGEKIVEELRECRRDFFAQAFGDLTDEERLVIAQALRKLVNVAESWGSSCCPR